MNAYSGVYTFLFCFGIWDTFGNTAQDARRLNDLGSCLSPLYAHYRGGFCPWLNYPLDAMLLWCLFVYWLADMLHARKIDAVLLCCALAAREDNLLGTCLAGVFPTPDVPEPSQEALKLYNTATSSGYATKDYEPPIGEKADVEPEPEFKLVSIAQTTYIDNPQELGKFERPSTAAAILEKVTSSGYAGDDYEPPVGEKLDIEAAPVFALSLRASTPSLDQIERPSTAPSKSSQKMLKQVQSTGYGKEWLPPVGEKFEREYYDNQGEATYESVGGDGGDGSDGEDDADGDGDGDDEITAMPLVEGDGVIDEY